MNNVDEPILAGCLNRRPTFEPKMVMKETESYLLQNLKSQLWAIGCVEICNIVIKYAFLQGMLIPYSIQNGFIYLTILNQGQVLQLHSATKQFAKLTETLFVETHERTNKEESSSRFSSYH
jgi:hypothetical protein